MSLQRRLLVFLLVCAPLVWSAALWVSVVRAREEVNELFDAEIIHLARQLQATVAGLNATAPQQPATPAASGAADLRDLAVAVWGGDGQLLLVDREGIQLPFRSDAVGFQDIVIGGDPWRVYYLQAPAGQWLVATGQSYGERDELVLRLTASQILPWVAMLPALLLAMTWAVRRSLAPVRALADDLGQREAESLQPVSLDHAPVELRPMVAAINGLFGRIEATLARERRFTADAAHELRTPLAVLRAQWDVLGRAQGEADKTQALAQLGRGIERMDRLVSQMLALARLDATDSLPTHTAVRWPAVVETALSEVLALADRRHIELACIWPPGNAAPFPLQGDGDLLAVLLRNLLDNAARYSPEGSTVTLRIGTDGLTIENEGISLPAHFLREMGKRFHRPEGQSEIGSGLGVSIARQIAKLHGLALHHRPREDGTGMIAELTRA